MFDKYSISLQEKLYYIINLSGSSFDAFLIHFYWFAKNNSLMTSLFLWSFSITIIMFVFWKFSLKIISWIFPLALILSGLVSFFLVKSSINYIQSNVINNYKSAIIEYKEKHKEEAFKDMVTFEKEFMNKYSKGRKNDSM